MQVQQASGRSIEGIGPDTHPFKDVEGFDSLSGVEATVLLSDSVGWDLPDSVFVPEQGSRALSVNEVADRVLSLHEPTEGDGMNEQEITRLEIASRLKLAREMAGLTQGQVASRLGWHRPTVSEIEGRT